MLNELPGHARPLPLVWRQISDLAARLRSVRVACGDWERVTGESVTIKHGMTGVFLDPPYGSDASRTENLYATDCMDVAAKCRDWAIDAAKSKYLRIAFAGYAGEHEFPPSWEAVSWKASGGYGSQGERRGRDNCEREMLWFSPACLSPVLAPSLFDLMGTEE